MKMLSMSRGGDFSDDFTDLKMILKMALKMILKMLSLCIAEVLPGAVVCVSSSHCSLLSPPPGGSWRTTTTTSWMGQKKETHGGRCRCRITHIELNFKLILERV